MAGVVDIRNWPTMDRQGADWPPRIGPSEVNPDGPGIGNRLPFACNSPDTISAHTRRRGHGRRSCLDGTFFARNGTNSSAAKGAGADHGTLVAPVYIHHGNPPRQPVQALSTLCDMMVSSACCFLAASASVFPLLAFATPVMQRDDTQKAAQNLLKESMAWMDMFYDADAGYLYSLDAAALTHETRASSWYAAGLLGRNEGDDAEQAVKIVENIIVGQHKNVSDQW